MRQLNFELATPSVKKKKKKTLRISLDFAGMAVSCMALKRMDVDFQMVDVTEIDPKCHRMIAALHGQARRSHYDITRRKQIGHAHLWMVTAPCQDFSTENGKRSGCKSRRRGKLIKSSMKALKKLKPKHRPRAIVFENVATRMTHKAHLEGATLTAQKGTTGAAAMASPGLSLPVGLLQVVRS